MSAPTVPRPPAYRWSREQFLTAWESGVFREHVELVEGEVLTVPIGPWHGDATMRCGQLLAAEGVIASSQTLATGDSLPDPDVWVRPTGATQSGQLSRRMVSWAPEDVLLVVEISDETVLFDLNTKARLYAAGGYAVYWVLTLDALLVHTGPGPDGYKTVVTYRAGEQVELPYGDGTVDVSQLSG